MRRFLGFMAFAAIIVFVVALSSIGVSAGAVNVEVSDNVIFISDSAPNDGVVGDGSSADKPLDVYTVPSYKLEENADKTVGRYYLKTALYQAAEKLSETGGTIVICGPVNIGKEQSYGSGSANRDFNFPYSDQPLRITSVYNGVDYAEKGAYLGIASPAQINLNSPTVFEYVTIKTTGTARVICGNGNKTVMGKGITCTNTNNSESANYYLSVVGGSRYLGLSADTEVVVESGCYNYVGGSNWGLDTGTVYTHKGNVTVTVKGGTVKGTICGGAVQAATTKLDGDVTINVYKDAQIYSPICGSGQAQFASEGHTVKVNVYGGGFTDSAACVKKYYTAKSNNETGKNFQASEYVLNVSNAELSPLTSGSGVDRLLNGFVTSAKNEGFEKILYPSKWVTEVTVLKMPTREYCFTGENFSSEGAKLSVEYKNAYDGNTIYSEVVEYSAEDRAFNVDFDNTSKGSKAAECYYGAYKYGTVNVNVYEAPSVEILGAQIQTSGSTQGLRFVAKFNKGASTEVTVEEYGVLAVRADLIEDRSCLDFDQMYGMNILTPNSYDINSVIGNTVYYTCTIKNIPINRFNIDTMARAFVKVKVGEDVSYLYSDIISKNPYQIALKASAESSREAEDVKSYLKSDVISIHDNYDVNTEYTDSTKYRNRVVDYMKAQMNLTWVAGDTFWINNPKDASGVATNLYFVKGNTYKGIPYTNNKFSQKESFGDLISDGVLSVSDVPGITACGNTSSDEAVAKQNYKMFPGSDCSTAVITAWNTVLNTSPRLKQLVQTKYMVPGNNCGVIPVGDYKYDYETYKNDTNLMTQDSANASKIRAAYSLLQPGDAIVHYDTTGSGSGHTRLVVSVNKTQKTVTTIECANWSIPNCSVTSGNGSKVNYTNNNTSWRQLTYNFDYLLKTGYIPITIPELSTGHSDSEYTLVTELDLKNDLPSGELNGKIASNRQIISVNITVSDGNTEQKIVHKPSPTAKTSDVHVSRCDLSLIDLKGIELTSGREYTFSLDVRVVGLSDKNPTVKLIKDYRFIAE